MAVNSMEDEPIVVEYPRDQRELTPEQQVTIWNILKERGEPLINYLQVAEELGI